MKISLSVVIVIILGVVAAGAAALLTAALSAGTMGNVLDAEVPDITILVAASDIAMMSPIREDSTPFMLGAAPREGRTGSMNVPRHR